MNLFEPPHERPVDAPVTLRRVALSLATGVVLGAGAAGLIFAHAWLLAANEGTKGGSFGLILASYAAFIIAQLLWRWSGRNQTAHTSLGWIARVVAGLGFLASIGLLLFVLSRLEFAPWFTTDAELVALVGVCGIGGLAIVWRQLRSLAKDRARISLWFAAAVTLWAVSDWGLRLGPSLERFDDPRYNIATFTVFAAGALFLVGVLALMDWHIRWRERRSIKQLAHNGAEHG